MTDNIHFGVLHSDGTMSNERDIARSDILACPHVIIVASHYREDGSCKCNDPDDTDMLEWEYTWSEYDGRWI